MTDLSNALGGLGGTVDNLVRSFETGQHDQVSDQSVQQSYGQVATQLSQDQYVQAARDAFSKLTPQQREELAHQLEQQAQQQGINVPATQNPPTDPDGLAKAVGQVHAEQPNLLQELFAPGGMFSSPAAKAALLGITAMAAQHLMGSHS